MVLKREQHNASLLKLARNCVLNSRFGFRLEIMELIIGTYIIVDEY